MKKDISDTLRIGSLICTILVIAIHYNSKSLIPIDQGYNINYYIQEFITEGLARIAVPYFALLSGYFASGSLRKEKSYISFIKKKAKTLLIPYFIAAYLIFYISSVISILLDDASSLTFYQIISYSKSVWTHPSEQLWFLRDLLILMCLVPILLHRHKTQSLTLGLILGGLWIFELQVFPIVQGWYILNIETLFFFTLGGVFQSIDSSHFSAIFYRKNLYILLIIWLTLTILRIWIKPDFFIWYTDQYTLSSLLIYKFSILVGIPLIISISNRLKNKNFLLYLSGLNFFAYLYHFFPLFYFRRFTQKIVPGGVTFYIDFLIATVFIYVFGLLLYQFIPRFYMIITGSRIPSRRIQNDEPG